MTPKAKPCGLGTTRTARFHWHGLTARRRGWGYYRIRPLASASLMPSLETFARALPRGRVWGDHVYFMRPGCKSKRRTCSLKIKDRGKNIGCDFIVKDHHRDAAQTWAEISALKDYVRKQVGIEWRPQRPRDPEAIKRKQAKQNTKRRVERARRHKTPLRVSRPWLAAGVSRATWYRHRGSASVRQIPPTPSKFPLALLWLLSTGGSAMNVCT